jgi:PAS domain-containing protein
MICRMRAKARCPEDLRLVFQHSLADAYELSRVLLARAGFDGTLQLLTSGWERSLGYQRGEFEGRTLGQLMGSSRRSTAAAVAAILDEHNTAPVELRMRCRDGLAKGLRLHRHYDAQERLMYIVAEEVAAGPAEGAGLGEQRRVAGRTG